MFILAVLFKTISLFISPMTVPRFQIRWIADFASSAHPSGPLVAYLAFALNTVACQGAALLPLSFRRCQNRTTDGGRWTCSICSFCSSSRASVSPPIETIVDHFFCKKSVV